MIKAAYTFNEVFFERQRLAEVRDQEYDIVFFVNDDDSVSQFFVEKKGSPIDRSVIRKLLNLSQAVLCLNDALKILGINRKIAKNLDIKEE